MINRVLKIIYDPVKARVIFDFLAALVVFVLSGLLVRIFYLQSWPFFLPLAFALCNTLFLFLFGIYTFLKTAHVISKTVTICLSTIFTLAVFYFLSLDSGLVYLSALFTVVALVLPRIFLDFKNSYSKISPLTQIISSAYPVLVVGGAGYIGSGVVKKLLDNRYRVKVLDKFVHGQQLFKNSGHPNLEIIEGDVSNLFKLTLAMQETQAVIHLAGLVGDPACALDSQLTRHVNVVSTRMLKETAKAFGIPRFIFASSCSVYGQSDELVDENSTLNPVSLYAQTKIDSEKELLQDTFDHFHPTILRFATVFGHSTRMRFDLVANLFVAQAYTNGKINVTGSQQWRPFIHVTDIAEAILQVVKSPLDKVSRQIFNVGDDRLNLTIGDLAELTAGIVKQSRDGGQVKVMLNDNPEDQRNYRVAFDKIAERLDFKANIDVKSGLTDIHQRFLQGLYSGQYSDSKYNNLAITRLLNQEFQSEAYQRQHFSTLTSLYPSL